MSVETEQSSDVDVLNYLVISNQAQPLSDVRAQYGQGMQRSIFPYMIDSFLLHESDIAIVVDDGFDDDLFTEVAERLGEQANGFVMIITDSTRRPRWNKAGYCVIEEQPEGLSPNTLANRFLESIDLLGLVCIDHYDLHAQIAGMQRLIISEGLDSGTQRAKTATVLAMPSTTPTTATLILSGGMDISLSEWEDAMTVLDSSVPDSTTTLGALKLIPSMHSSEPVRVILMSAYTENI